MRWRRAAAANGRRAVPAAPPDSSTASYRALRTVNAAEGGHLTCTFIRSGHPLFLASHPWRVMSLPMPRVMITRADAACAHRGSPDRAGRSLSLATDSDPAEVERLRAEVCGPTRTPTRRAGA